VDRSIQDTRPFIKTNVNGTQILLDISRRYGINKFIHISTDETYGEIKEGRFSENSPLMPNSPYAASKAAADLLIKSYIRTYGFPAIVIRPCNNYGPWQYPEKFIPLAILRILRGEKIPVYGKGKNVREWLYVTDCAEGIFKIMEKGRLGEIYNLGSGQERQNIDIARTLLKILKKDKKSIEFVQDRPGHDIRYSLNSEKVFREFGWQPKIDLSCGLIKLVDWCIKNRDWLFSKYSNINSLYAKIRCGQ
jgi:dTDP-glucose 4,6-dehydratase